MIINRRSCRLGNELRCSPRCSPQRYLASVLDVCAEMTICSSTLGNRSAKSVRAKASRLSKLISHFGKSLEHDQEIQLCNAWRGHCAGFDDRGSRCPPRWRPFGRIARCQYHQPRSADKHRASCRGPGTASTTRLASGGSKRGCTVRCCRSCSSSQRIRVDADGWFAWSGSVRLVVG